MQQAGERPSHGWAAPLLLCPSHPRPRFCSPAPVMGAHDLRVMMLRTVGAFCPNSVTREAIWMTGSLSGSGKWPWRGRGGGGEESLAGLPTRRD